ncbi:MAG: HD domain-containing protein [bacterium]|nr:HD domain-containing protein [bacterium]
MRETLSFNMATSEKTIETAGERLEREPIFAWLKEIKKEFPRGEMYLVGGAARDMFLKRPCKDYDFIARGIEPKKLQEFLGQIGVVNLVGRVFGVFKFTPLDQYEKFKQEKLEPFDVALPRTEHSYLSGGYRDFEVQSDSQLPIEKDLERRDFTINAIALRITNGDEYTNPIIDPYNGRGDLQDKIIRAVGNPEHRFKEDYSRMLRALRQACQLGFTIEEKTFATIKKNAGALMEKIPLNPPFQKGEAVGEWIVPRETIAKETLKAFHADPVRAFDLFNESGFFKVLLPEVEQMKNCPQPEQFHSEGDVFVHTRLALETLQTKEYKKLFGENKPSAQLVMAILLHDIGKPPTLKTPEAHGTERIRFDEHNDQGAEMAKKIIKRLKLESLPEGTALHLDEKALVWLIKNHLLLAHGDPQKMRAGTIEKYFFNPLVPGDELRRLSYCDIQATVPPSGQPDMTNFDKMTARVAEVGKFAREKNILPPPILNGEEIMKILKIKPGPQVGKVILALREEQLEGRVTDKEEAKKFIKSTGKY